MKLLAISILFLMLAGCAYKKAQLVESLSSECEVNDFRGNGIGNSNEEALNAAHSNLAKQIFFSINVSETYSQKQLISGDSEYVNSEYESKAVIEATLLNAQDIQVIQIKQKNNKAEALVCMSRTNAAKGFIERQNLIADSLEMVSHILLGVEHTKRKSDAWHKTQYLWNEFVKIQNLLESWNAANANLFDSVNKTYAKTRDSYKAHCKNFKLYWVPEQENDYSVIAFSMLSKNLKMEKSVCENNGISLVYKHSTPDCSRKYGIYNCIYKAYLSVASCGGTEYSILDNMVENSHQKHELALEKTNGALKQQDFWIKFEEEIKEWVPKCE